MRGDPEAPRLKNAAKIGSSTKDSQGLVTGLTTSKCFRDIGPDDTDAFILLPTTRIFTLRDRVSVGCRTATSSTCPSSTMFKIRTPLSPGVAPAIGESALLAPKQRPLVSWEALRRRNTISWQGSKSDTTCWLHPPPNRDQGLYSLLTMILSEAATASFNNATPLSKKKLVWVNEASRTSFFYTGDDSFNCLPTIGHPI